MKIYKKAEIQKRAFITTVNVHNAVAKDGGSIHMDTNADYTWSDVLSAQESFSQGREIETSRGVKGLMYKQLRRFGDNGETFHSWLKLLPTESHYLSVLCGGLTLILGAARQMSEIRENVRSFVEDLPSRLSKAKAYIDIFEDSPQLHQCSADLYVAILSTLDDIVHTYHKHVARKYLHLSCSMDTLTDSLQVDSAPHSSSRNGVAKSFKKIFKMYRTARTDL